MAVIEKFIFFKLTFKYFDLKVLVEFFVLQSQIMHTLCGYGGLFTSFSIQ